LPPAPVAARTGVFFLEVFALEVFFLEAFALEVFAAAGFAFAFPVLRRVSGLRSGEAERAAMIENLPLFLSRDTIVMDTIAATSLKSTLTAVGQSAPIRDR